MTGVLDGVRLVRTPFIRSVFSFKDTLSQIKRWMTIVPQTTRFPYPIYIRINKKGK